MNKKKEDLKKNQARKISIKEGSAWSLMEGFGSRYITPYALYLGASNSQIGFLSSFPGLLGNIFQIPALKLFRNKNNTRKKIVFNTFTTNSMGVKSSLCNITRMSAGASRTGRTANSSVQLLCNSFFFIRLTSI